MSFLDLPAEIVYDIVGEVVACYADLAITTPPKNSWKATSDDLESEWYTDEGNSDSSQDIDGDSEYNWQEVPGVASTSEDGEDHSYETMDDSLSVAADSVPEAYHTAQADDLYVESEDSEDEVMVEESPGLTLDLGDSLSMWILEQERQTDPENLLVCKLYLWNMLERREKLPKNPIACLLRVSHNLRETTLKVLCDALGLETTADGSLNHNSWDMLLFLRRHYRIAHTQPFDLCLPKYPAAMTPFVNCYLSISSFAYSLRNLHKFAKMDDPSLSHKIIGDMFNLTSVANEVPQSIFRPRIAKRVGMMLVHLRRYISVSIFCSDITFSYKEMFSLKGTAKNPGFIVHEDKIPDFTEAVRDFVTFDRRHMDRKGYNELPGPLINLCGVVKALNNIKRLKYILEFRRNAEIMSATHAAIELSEKWKRRAESSAYVVLEDV